jgi:hypothetical protein
MKAVGYVDVHFIFQIPKTGLMDSIKPIEFASLGPGAFGNVSLVVP